jgi:solute carrier family 25 (adenine nucleotide translocator) protein 4/5/6/31
MSEEAAAAAARAGAGDDGAAGAAAAALRAGRAWEFKRDLAAGALMGGAVHTVVAPIERVKLLLQTQDGNAALLGRSRRFRGFFDCVARTVREEGVLSLWRGNGTAVIRYYPSVALNFSLKVPPPDIPFPLYHSLDRLGAFQLPFLVLPMLRITVPLINAPLIDSCA